MNFNSVPQLLVTPRSTSCSSQKRAIYSATITKLSNTGATVYISRVDANDTWSTTSLQLDWLAWEANSTSSSNTDDDDDLNGLMTEGIETFSINSNENETIVMNFTFDNSDASASDFIVNMPVVLVSIEQTSPVVSNNNDAYFFIVTTANVYQKGFGINLLLANPDVTAASSAPLGTIDLTLRYWAFERITIENDVSSNVTNKVIQGSLLDELQQVFKTNYSQSFVVFNINTTKSSSSNDDDLRYIDTQIHLGPIDQGSEFVTRFETELDTNYTWYTNQNALEYVKRVYNPTIDERIGGNYFPSTSQSYIKDTSNKYMFSTIVDVAHGVGCHKNGMYELMLHRRCTQNDGKGLNEILNTTTHIEPKIWMIFDNINNATRLNRRLFNLQQFYPIKFWSLTSDTITQWNSKYNTSFNAMTNEYYNDNDNDNSGLPENIHLQDLRYAYSGGNNGNGNSGDGDSDNQGLIMQFQHMYEINENSQLSNNVSIDMNNIIRNDILLINQSIEMTLTANLPLSELNRLQWNIKDENGNVKRINQGNDIKRKLKDRSKNKNGNSDSIVMKPRDIRTFVINQDVSKKMRGGVERTSIPKRLRRGHA